MMLLNKDEAVEKGWLKTSENQDKLIDHYFYLVTHCDYGTPMKAKYHDDAGGYFELLTYECGKFCEFINPIFQHSCRCKYFMPLPEMPDDYKEVK